MAKLETQQTEIIGRGLLHAHLIEGGIEVARPERDHGVDLIAYVVDAPGGFLASPIQLKAATARSFGIWRKYQGTPGLLMVFVWNVGEPGRQEIYAMTYSESLEIARALGYTSSASWSRDGRYESTSPSRALIDSLEPYRMTDDSQRWSRRLREASVDREERGVRATWLNDASDSLAGEERWQALSDEGRAYSEPDAVPLESILDLVGRDAVFVVRSHTEGLGPKALTGFVVGLADIITRGYGRLRPFPAVEVHTSSRRVVVPVNLVEAVYLAEHAEEIDLPDPYDFGALTPDDDVTGMEYISLYPHELP